MLAKAKLYRGIEFVSVGELPDDQQSLLLHSSDLERIKIMMDEKILTNCIQYREYYQWYTRVFNQSSVLTKAEPALEKVSLLKGALVKSN